MTYKEKILPGFMYQIGIDMKALTGSEGALQMGKLLEEKEYSDDMIQEFISVYVNKECYPLSHLSVAPLPT